MEIWFQLNICCFSVFQIQPSHGVCYIPFDGLEHSFPQYNVLVVQ
jgi:hypothetical protein